MTDLERNVIIRAYRAETWKLKAFRDRAKAKYGGDRTLEFLSDPEREELEKIQASSAELALKAGLTFEEERQIGVPIFAGIDAEGNPIQ